MPPEDRILPFAQIYNFRDCGDYTVRGGGRIKKGLLYRCGHHVDATDADLEQLQTLHLARIIDLRHAKERAAFPCRRHPAFAGEIIFAQSDENPAEAGLPPEQNEAREDNRRRATEIITLEDVHTRMRASYAAMLHRPAMAAAYRTYFSGLADVGGAQALHCVAGKDRTGIAIALLHDFLGACEDDIFADYLLSNDTLQNDARIASGARVIRGLHPQHIPDEVIAVLMNVRADYLAAMLAVLRSDFGDARGYLQKALGLSNAQLAAIAQNYLV